MRNKYEGKEEKSRRQVDCGREKLEKLKVEM